jgi:hypothetical protein
MGAQRYVPDKEGIARSRAAQRARGVVQLPGADKYRGLSVLPFVLPVGSIYQGADDRKGRRVEVALEIPALTIVRW